MAWQPISIQWPPSSRPSPVRVLGYPTPLPNRPLGPAREYKPEDAVADELTDVVTGAKNPLAWYASGRKPVDPCLALRRAGTCVTCKMNGSGPLTQWFTVPAAELIKLAMEARLEVKMTTMYDAALGVCEACHCPLPLKVHEPIDLVLKGLKPKQRAKLWEKCWILREEGVPEEPKNTEQ